MKNMIITAAWGLLCLFLLTKWSSETTIENNKRKHAYLFVARNKISKSTSAA